jgi:peroxiredoxin
LVSRAALALGLSLALAGALAAQDAPDPSDAFQDRLARLLDRWNDDAPPDRLAKAIELCEKHLATSSDDSEAEMELARFKLAKGDTEPALISTIHACDLSASLPERLKEAKALHFVAFTLVNAAKATTPEQTDKYEKEFVDLYNKLVKVAGSKEAADALVNAERERVQQATVLNELGRPAKALDRKDTDGKPIRLDSFLGKIVIVDFWAAGFAQYQNEVKNTIAVRERFKDRIEVIGISLDRDRALLDGFVKAYAVPWRQVFSGMGLGDDTARAWGVPGGRRFLIDHDGKVRFVNVRGEGLAAAVQQLVERADKAAGGRGGSGNSGTAPPK